jgi:hypothetical protein
MSKNGYMYYGSLKSFQGKTFDTGIILKNITIQKRYWKSTIDIRILVENKELLYFAPSIRFTTIRGNFEYLPIYKIHLPEFLSVDAASYPGVLRIEVSNIPSEKVMIRAKVL